MVRGRDVTPEQRRRILELAAESRGETEFVLSARQIGERVGIGERSVNRVIRYGAKRYVDLIKRHPDFE
jgi:hypothetical protein